MENIEIELAKAKYSDKFKGRRIRLAILGAALLSLGGCTINEISRANPSHKFISAKSRTPKNIHTQAPTKETVGTPLTKISLCNIPVVNELISNSLPAGINQIDCHFLKPNRWLLEGVSWNVISRSKTVDPSEIQIIIERSTGHSLSEVNLGEFQGSQLNNGLLPNNQMSLTSPINNHPSIWFENATLTTRFTNDELINVFIRTAQSSALKERVATEIATIVEDQAF